MRSEGHRKPQGLSLVSSSHPPALHTPQNTMNLEPSSHKCERYAAAVAFYIVVVDSPVFRNVCQNEELYIKGYKIDREKLLNNFTPRPEDPQNTRMMLLWREFLTEFLYLARGKEPDGRFSLVIVLAEGHDKEKLEQEPMVDLTHEPYSKIFTPGIWVKYD